MAATLPLQSPIRVLVVDDHAGIRIGVSSLINGEQPDMRTVGTASTAAEALAQTFALQPDVVVLDVDLNGEDGLALVPALHRAAACEVVVLTSLADPHVALHAMHIGARACLHKTAPAGELLLCIRQAGARAAGEFAATPSNAGVAMSHAERINHP